MRIATRDDYDELHRQFRWHVPERFNIAQVCCARWAGDARRTAIVVDHGDGRVERFAYRRLHEDADRVVDLGLSEHLVDRHAETVAAPVEQRLADRLARRH